MSDIGEIKDIAKRSKHIVAVWAVSDVQEVRPDLTDEQAWDVLQSVDRKHDASIGINWAVLQATADFMFPERVAT